MSATPVAFESNAFIAHIIPHRKITHSIQFSLKNKHLNNNRGFADKRSRCPMKAAPRSAPARVCPALLLEGDTRWGCRRIRQAPGGGTSAGPFRGVPDMPPERPGRAHGTTSELTGHAGSPAGPRRTTRCRSTRLINDLRGKTTSFRSAGRRATRGLDITRTTQGLRSRQSTTEQASNSNGSQTFPKWISRQVAGRHTNTQPR